MQKVKVVGLESFKSKSGNVCTILHVVKPINKRDAHIDVAGEQAVSYFVPDNCKSKISPALVGKEISVYIAYFGGKENLLDIIQ